MKFLRSLTPRTIVIAIIAIGLLMFGSAYLELHQSRTELSTVMRNEAISLVQTIERSSVNILRTSEQVEQLIAERLLTNARFIAQLDSERTLTGSDLETFARKFNLFRINIFTRNGRRVLSNHTPQHRESSLQRFSPDEYLEPILSGREEELVIGLRDARVEEGKRFAVAVRRTRPGGGAIVVNLDASAFLEFRKAMGIGKLIQDLGLNTGIRYIILQDDEGIVAANSALQEISSFASDSLLRTVIERDTSMTRIHLFGNDEVFEVLAPFHYRNELLGLFRVGLSMEELHATEDRMIRRMIIISIVMVVLIGLVTLIVLANQSYGILSERFRAMQTFTGTILEHMQDAVITIDGQKRITLFNNQAEQLFGIPEASVLGIPIDQPGIHLTAPLRDIFLISDPEAERTIELQGITRILSLRFSDTFTGAGDLQSRTVVIRDLTEARMWEREQQRKDKLTAMGELAAGVAHEIRNPLNAISMIAQRLEKEFTPKGDIKEYRSLAAILRQEAQRVNGIIQQFLRFARPAKADLRPILLNEFLATIGRIFESQARQKKITFNLTCSDPVMVMIDEGLLTQALLNILQNALEATGNGGTITLACTAEENSALVKISDTGSGIAGGHLEQVFDLYYTTKPDGTGMGLAITQQIVSQHHGSIHLNSHPGSGTVVTIVLPLMPAS